MPIIKGGVNQVIKKEKTQEGRMFWYIVLATIPGGIIGFILDKFCANILEQHVIIAIDLMAGLFFFHLTYNREDIVVGYSILFTVFWSAIAGIIFLFISVYINKLS